MDFQDFLAKNGRCKDKIGERVAWQWPPVNSLTFWDCYLCAALGKIDQQMRPWECTQTDRYMHRQTKNDFIICPVLYAIAMGQIIKFQSPFSICLCYHVLGYKHEIYYLYQSRYDISSAICNHKGNIIATNYVYINVDSRSILECRYLAVW